MIEGLDDMMAGLRSHSLSDITKPTAAKDETNSRRLSSSTPSLLKDTPTTPQAAGGATQTGLTGQAEEKGSSHSIPEPSIEELMSQSEGTYTVAGCLLFTGRCVGFCQRLSDNSGSSLVPYNVHSLYGRLQDSDSMWCIVE